MGKVKRPDCPMCGAPLKSNEVPVIQRQGEKIRCECGADCWVRQAADGSGLFVPMFRPNKPLKVRVTDPESSS